MNKTVSNALPDNERCYNGRWSPTREWCPERGYQPKNRQRNGTDGWVWCGLHQPMGPVVEP